eukprot:5879599-Pleurochrysis_carterae.AAC.2
MKRRVSTFARRLSVATPPPPRRVARAPICVRRSRKLAKTFDTAHTVPVGRAVLKVESAPRAGDRISAANMSFKLGDFETALAEVPRLRPALLGHITFPICPLYADEIVFVGD